MCSLCGALGLGTSWEQGGLDGAQARWRLHREAVATAAELTLLLRAARIRISANPDFGFVVAFATGRTEMVASLADLWHLLDRRKVGIPDPLVV